MSVISYCVVDDDRVIIDTWGKSSPPEESITTRDTPSFTMVNAHGIVCHL